MQSTIRSNSLEEKQIILKMTNSNLSNRIEYRATLDKKEALYRSVEAAMPTVFTSGMILTICGFVIGFISSQNAISTVGILLGKGTLVSVLMITLVLPSILYLLDGFILKLSIKKKSNE